MSNLRAQTYLYQFYREVVEEALANGLDKECYYDFLSEMFFALPGDDTLRPAYENAIHETRQQTKLEQNLDTATRWVVDYYKIFSIQSDFLTKMVAFIEKYSDDDVLAICRAQLDFAGKVLWRQRRFLDMIMLHEPSRELFASESASAQEFGTALVNYNAVLRLVADARMSL